MPRRVSWWIAPLLIPLSAAVASAVPSAPPNFVVENAFPGVTFTLPTDMVWLPDGRLLVAEKAGKVWVVTNGVKAAQPMLDISPEVLNADDRGLLGITCDPKYFVNHYIYLLYVVDPDSNNVETNSDAFSRLARYTVSFTDSSTVIPSSRRILIGVDWPSGVVSAGTSHAIGDLKWGADGSLLVSAGDAADFNQADAGGLQPGSFGPGKTNPYEDIGGFRSQSLSSLAGKILRINPATGNGYASNPFADANLADIRSRIWEYGFRNPFRFTVRPGTGVADTSAGNPGVLFIGDVGWNSWEEENVARTGGLNFGWPCIEGPSQQPAYQDATPSHNGCDSIGTFDNPSSPTAPALYYYHNATLPSSPPGMAGNTATGGIFYQGASYPGEYRQQFIFEDYGASWIMLGTVDANHNIIAVAPFIDNADSPVCLGKDPVSGDVLYISITTGEVRRIRYTGATGNANPIASGTGTPTFGLAPLPVAFSSSGSYDPDNDPFTVSWNFGDGTGSSAANPAHTFTRAGTYTVVLTATDSHGGIGRDTLLVTATTQTSFPSTPVVDNFNRANGALGGSWVDYGSLTISSNQLATAANYASPVWDGAMFGPNQEAYVTLATINSAAIEHDILLKVQGLTWDTGHIEVKYDAKDGVVVVSTYSPVESWVTRGGPYPVTLQAGDRFGARATADGTVEVYVNSTRLAVLNLASWVYSGQGGHIGLTLSGPTGSRLDDFGGGDVNYGNNTKPVGTIGSPKDSSFFITGQTIQLKGTAVDAQDPPDSLSYLWNVVLHHNNHVHFGLSFPVPSDSFVTANEDDGTGVFYRCEFHVTDTGGLSDSTSVDILDPTGAEAVGIDAVSPGNDKLGQMAEYIIFDIVGDGRRRRAGIDGHHATATRAAAIRRSGVLIECKVPE